MKKISVLFFKRDIRTIDHLPLNYLIEKNSNILPIYILDPLIHHDEHYSERHWNFVKESIHDLNLDLAKFNGEIYFFEMSYVDVFKKIKTNFQIEQIVSYQEIGLKNSWECDKSLKKWCDVTNIQWIELPYSGIIRGLNLRANWIKHWYNHLKKPLADNDLDKAKFIKTNLLPNTKIKLSKNSNFQIGGQKHANLLLDKFLDNNGNYYNKNISKPYLSVDSCSRLSPYLSWGNLSIKYVINRLKKKWDETGKNINFSGFYNRLRWRDHFIQKFESQPSIEFQNINSGYDNFPFRDDSSSEIDLENWANCKSGFLLVDASMKSLIETGYVNFRMRAMVTSFVCHQLLISWQRASFILSKLFLDFEPGIHYSQLQMQASTTGINTVRIYSPLKQIIDNDADGKFIKKWFPQFNNIDDMVFGKLGGVLNEEQIKKYNYCHPIVSFSESYKRARDLFHRWKKNKNVRSNRDIIVKKLVK